ncbi:MAG TPA: 16S rRNA (guanine(527)-N(7))-methyltransferase RsmG [Thermoleophilia bacterium]|nr:16S rRNA (guanine(527)-N(7))-methyltransferase RsmG [Thermoleophilia bacterium]
MAAIFGLDADQGGALARYVDLVLHWRESNITALRNREDILRVLIGDSLALLDVPELQQLAGDSWVDLGAGAGLPGVPLCVALPSMHLTLLESAAKKCAFLEAAVQATGVAERALVVRARSETYAARGQLGREAFAVVLARAVAPLPVLVELAAPLLRMHGVLVASKTHRAMGEEGAAGAAAAARCGLAVGSVVALPRSPLDDAVGVVYEKIGPTPQRLPRREGLAAKRPLGVNAMRAAPRSPSVSIGDPAEGDR